MPRKLGQHFLHSQVILRRIAAAACAGGRLPVIEIGPGRGALTERLLECAAHVTAIEVDAAMVACLEERFSDDRRLEIVHADILATDVSSWLPAVIAGNLPYYITSPILEKVLALGGRFLRAVFLVQKEFAGRLTAGPGSRKYGYLTVHARLLAEVRTLFRVPPGAFTPPPQVDSAVVEIVPRPAPLVANPAGFLEFASACFRSKRKTLRNNLKVAYPAIAARPEANLRAEQLSLDRLIELHRVLLQER